MSGWGKGWEVGVRKQIWRHEQVQKQAAQILAVECGSVHKVGTRTDLCPVCQAALASCGDQKKKEE